MKSYSKIYMHLEHMMSRRYFHLHVSQTSAEVSVYSQDMR